MSFLLNYSYVRGTRKQLAPRVSNNGPVDLYIALRYVLGLQFCISFESNFFTSFFLWGSTVILVGRCCFHRLSIQTTVVYKCINAIYGTVWYVWFGRNFRYKLGLGVVSPQFVEGMMVGVKDGSPSNPLVTSWLP